MENRRQTHAVTNRFPIEKNERLTALAGAFIFVLVIVEMIVTANLHKLIMVHIFVGVLMSGPIIVKMVSTGYRFVRYYAKTPVFVQNGAPHGLLRLLAPFLVLVTIFVFVSGFGLALVGPEHMGLIFKLHAASVALWIPLLAVHVYAHFRKVPATIVRDWTAHSEHRVPGRVGRLGINVMALMAGLLAAVVMLPISKPWGSWRIDHGLPSPLVLGIAAAIVGVLIAIPVFKWANVRTRS